MSKLFNTLEQIRNNEPAPDTGRPPAAPIPPLQAPKPKKTIRALLVAILVSIILLAFVLWDKNTLSPTIQSLIKGIKTGDIATTVSSLNKQDVINKINTDRVEPKKNLPITPVAPAPSLSPADQVTKLNNLGAKHIENQEYWLGIYSFTEALKIQPKQIEPIINTAVALTEIGLFAPARRYFSMALSLEPGNPILQKNIAVLTKIGQWDDPSDNQAGGKTPSTDEQIR